MNAEISEPDQGQRSHNKDHCGAHRAGTQSHIRRLARGALDQLDSSQRAENSNRCERQGKKHQFALVAARK